LKRLLLWLAAALLVAYVALVAAVAWAMRQPPEVFGRFMSHMPAPAYLVLPFETLWVRARVGKLQVGQPAPDFKLQTLDKTAHVQLSELRGKPVVLVFGSYT
jgi:hypothetical protein